MTAAVARDYRGVLAAAEESAAVPARRVDGAMSGASRQAPVPLSQGRPGRSNIALLLTV